MLPVGLSPRIFRGKCEIVGVTQRTLRIIVSDNSSWLDACWRLNCVCLYGQNIIYSVFARFYPRAARMRGNGGYLWSCPALEENRSDRASVCAETLIAIYERHVLAARRIESLVGTPLRKRTLKDAGLLLKGYTSRRCGARVKKLKGTRNEETSAG